LSDTAHALMIEAEVLQHVGFRKSARVISSVAAEMNQLSSIPSPELDSNKEQRDAVKERWQDRVTYLYRPYFPYWYGVGK
jgi:hypothetical protein